MRSNPDAGKGGAAAGPAGTSADAGSAGGTGAAGTPGGTADTGGTGAASAACGTADAGGTGATGGTGSTGASDSMSATDGTDCTGAAGGTGAAAGGVNAAGTDGTDSTGASGDTGSTGAAGGTGAADGTGSAGSTEGTGGAVSTDSAGAAGAADSTGAEGGAGAAGGLGGTGASGGAGDSGGTDAAGSSGGAGAAGGMDATRGAGVGLLAGLLAQARSGPVPTAVELAEVLWLAAHIPSPEAPAPPPRPTASPVTDRPHSPEAVAPTHLRGAGNCAAGPSGPAPEIPARPEPSDTRVPLRLPGPGTPTPGREAQGPFTSLLAPAPPMLPHPLTLQRALRPLKRSVPAPVGQELDEAATAHRIARLGADPQWWLPVLRPMTERWLTLHLVHDTGPTMPVWRPLVRELHTALAQSGIFRTVELHRLEADGTVRRPGSQESFADGRTVTLLLSDCMGPQWRDGPPGARWYGTLRRWSARMPVALVQPLPERLWRTTALPATTARITAPGPAAPNSAYTVDSYALEGLPYGIRPLPVLEASAPWLANWSSLVASGGRLPGAVSLLGPGPPLAPVDEHGLSDVERLSAEELLLRFRSLASPEAFRLAGHLAVGPTELPVMRLVHAAIERHPRPQHLAEVILSGALIALPGATGSYVFRPGVRELLRRTLPRSAYGRTSELLARVGALIDERAGLSAGEFRVLAPGGGGGGTGPGGQEAAGEPFAAVREESVRRMGGPPSKSAAELVLGRYRLEHPLGPGTHVTHAHARDTRLDRTVTVHRYTVAPERRQRFLETARTLASVEHPNVLAVHDYGFEDGTAYLVTEFVEGLTVAELTAEGGFQLPFTLLAPLAQQVAQGLKALHAHGVVQGGLTPRSLLLRPDGTVQISPHAQISPRPQTSPRAPATDDARGESKDLEDLGHLLRELAEGEPPGELGGVPGEFRSRFDDAVRPLVATDLATQRRGRDLFLTPSYSRLLDAVTAHEYRYRLLGPVRISRRLRTLPANSPREQALLSMLLLRHGRTVTYDELTAGLWGQRPPQRAGRLLATYAKGLRDTLGPGVVATTADGYALYATPHTIDVNRCQELIAAAKSLRDAGDPTEARDAVQRALDLWDGHPVDDVPGPAAETTRTRLRALRLTLCVTRAELDLELGRFEQAAADLGDLLRFHPDREDFRRLHMLSLKGQGRIAEAIDSYEAYEELQDRQFGEPDPTLLELYRELRAAPDDNRPTVTMEFTEPGGHRGAHSTLSHTMAWLLSLSGLTSDQYDMQAVDNGYLVLTSPGASVLNVLNATLRDLPDILLEVPDPPRIRLTFWHTARPPRTTPLPPSLEQSDIAVVVSPVLYEELTSGDVPVGPVHFRPLRPEAGDGPPLAWSCRLEIPDNVPDPPPGRRDLVRGPFSTRRRVSIPLPEPGRTAVVFQPPDGALALFDPDAFSGTPTSGPRLTYYEVDLTTRQAGHELSLPSSGGGAFAASVELSWHVDDPVAFVHGETANVSERLLDHLLREARRITRRHPLRRAGAAQHALHSGLRGWPVPGLSVACSIRLTPEGEPPPTHEPKTPPPPETTSPPKTASPPEAASPSETPSPPETAPPSQTPSPSETARQSGADERSGTPPRTKTPPRTGTPPRLQSTRHPEAPLPAPARPSVTTQPPTTTRQAAAARSAGPAARRPEHATAAAALLERPCVLLGFDGPLVRLYTSDTEKQAARELAALLAELRDPEAALRGEPLSPQGGPTQPLEGRSNPLDLLRAFAGHPLGADLRRRLNRIEERAVSTAAPTPFSDALITTLSSLGRRTAVVADNAPSAVWRYLHSHGRLTGLVTGGVHGRADDLTLLMPNPDCLLRALDHLGVPPKDAVLVGSSVAELTAARAAGVRFLGYTRSEGHKRRLVRAGCEVTTASWAPLLRALPNT
ncbi:SAV_2336 N-terminal domain-related protein [Streptomyces sp. SD11]|uniref:SAV_2336 N-terminal domain-related protein n=1 Tax=Streptomyces sp. SD11 TaxID=3452209 RepID=UPI003F8C8893